MIFFRPARSSAQPRRRAGDRTPRLGILLLILLGLAGPAHAAEDEGKPKPPPTKYICAKEYRVEFLRPSGRSSTHRTVL